MARPVKPALGRPALGGGPALRRAAVYAAVGIAIMALLVAVYAASQVAPPPKPKATAKVPNAISIPAPGVHYVEVGWVYVEQPSYVQVAVNSSMSWIRLGDYWAQGPAATFAVDRGNYTLGLVVDVPANNTVIKVEVRVLS